MPKSVAQRKVGHVYEWFW